MDVTPSSFEENKTISFVYLKYEDNVYRLFWFSLAQYVRKTIYQKSK